MGVVQGICGKKSRPPLYMLSPRGTYKCYLPTKMASYKYLYHKKVNKMGSACTVIHKINSSKYSMLPPKDSNFLKNRPERALQNFFNGWKFQWETFTLKTLQTIENEYSYILPKQIPRKQNPKIIFFPFIRVSTYEYFESKNIQFQANKIWTSRWSSDINISSNANK